MGAYEDQLQSMFDSIGVEPAAVTPEPAQQQAQDPTSEYQKLFDEMVAPPVQEAAPVPAASPEVVPFEGVKRAVKGLMEIPERVASSYKTGEATDTVVESLGAIDQHMKNVRELMPYINAEGRLTPEGQQRADSIVNIDTSAFPANDPILTKNTLLEKLGSGLTVQEATKELDAATQEALDGAKNTILLEQYTGPQAGKYMEALLATKGDITAKEALDVATSGEAIIELMADTLLPSLLIGMGSVAGGVAGSVLLPAGGTAAGAAAGAYLVSSGMETRRAFMDGLIEDDVDVFNVEEVRNFITNNPQRLETILSNAQKQGAAVGALDAVSVGFGGRILNKLRTALKGKGKVAVAAGGAAAITAEQVLQGTYGAAGAALGKVVSGQDIDPDEVFLEFMGEIYGGGLMDVGIGSAADRVDKLHMERRKLKDEVEAHVTDRIYDQVTEAVEKNENVATVGTQLEEVDSPDPIDDESVDPLDSTFADEEAAPEPAPVDDVTTLIDTFNAGAAEAKAKRELREQKEAERTEARRTEALEAARLQGEADTAERKQGALAAYNEGRGVVPEVIAQETGTVAEPATTEAGTLAEVNAKIDAGVQENLDVLEQETPDKVAPTPEAAPTPKAAPKKAAKAEPAPIAEIQDVDEFEKELAPVLEADTTVEEEQAPPAYEPDILAEEVAAIDEQGFTDAEIAGLGKAAGVTIDGIATPEDKQAIAEWMLDNNDMDPAEARVMMLDALAGKVDNRVAEEKPATKTAKQVVAPREQRLAEEKAARLQKAEDELAGTKAEETTESKKLDADIDRQAKQAELDAEYTLPLRPDSKKGEAPVTKLTRTQVKDYAIKLAAVKEVRARNRALLHGLNQALWSRQSIVHKTEPSSSQYSKNGMGSNPTGHWKFIDVDEQGNFVLEFSRRNEDGTDQKDSNGMRKSATYKVDFVTGTAKLAETTGGVTRSKVDLPRGKNSIGELIFMAYGKALEANAVLGDTSTTLEELGNTITREQHVKNVQRRVKDAQDDKAYTGKKLDNAMAILDKARKVLWAAQANPYTKSVKKEEALKAFYADRADWAVIDRKYSRLKDIVAKGPADIAAARTAQADTIAQFTTETGKLVREDGTPAEFKDISKRMATRPEDAGAGVKTFMDSRELTGILRSEIQTAHAVQVLPNGEVRSVRIDIPVKGDKLLVGEAYEARVEQVSYGKLKQPVPLGPTGFKIDRRKAKKLAEDYRDQRKKSIEAVKEQAADDPGRRTARPGTPTPRGLSEQARKESTMDKKERTGAVTEADKVVIGVLSQRAANMRNKLDLTRALLNAKRGIEGAADAQGLIDAVVNEETQAKLQAELDEIKDMTEPQLVERFADLEAGLAVTNAKIAKAGGSQTTGAQSKGESRRVGPVYTTDPDTGERVPTPDAALKSVEVWPFAFPAEYKRSLAYEKGRSERRAKEQEAQRLKELKGNAEAKLKSLKLKNKEKAGAARRSLMLLHVNEINQMFQGTQLREVAELMGIRPKRSRGDTAMAIREQAKQEIEAWEAENNQQVERRPEAEGVTPQQRADALMLQRGEAPQRFVTLGYILELQDSLRKQGHSEVMIEQVVKDVIDSSKGIDPAAKRAAYVASQIAQKERTQQETAPTTPVATRDEVEQYLMVQSAIKQAADPTTETGVITEKLIDAIHGAGTTEQLEGFSRRSPYYEGVTEFARAPVMMGGKTKLQAEMDALREQGAQRIEEPRPTLTVPEVKPRVPRKKFGVDNKLVTPEEAGLLLGSLHGKVRSGMSKGDFEAAVKLTIFYIEGGIRTFADYVNQIASSLENFDIDLAMPALRAAWKKAGGEKVEKEYLEAQAAKVEGPDTVEGENPTISKGLEVEDMQSQEEPTGLDAEVGRLTGKVTPTKLVNENTTTKATKLTPAYTGTPTVRGTSSRLARYIKLWTSSANTLIGEAKGINTLIRHTRARVNGFVLQAQRFSGQYMAAIQDAGIKIGSKAHFNLNRATTAMLDGMSVPQAEKKFGTTIPPQIQKIARGIAAVKGELAREGMEMDALPLNVRAAVDKNNGEIWLHKSFQSTPFVTALFQDTIGGGKTALDRIGDFDPHLKSRILKAAHIAYELPTDPNDMKFIPTQTIRSWIGGSNALYKTSLGPGSSRYILPKDQAVISKTTGEPIIDKETGKPKRKVVYVNEATREQLLEFIHDNPLDRKAIERWQINTVNDLFSPSATTQEAYVSDGGPDSSISKKRKLLLTDGEQIRAMLSLIEKSEVLTPETKAGIRKIKDDAVAMSRDEFMRAINNLPDRDVARVLARTDAEYDIAEAIRRGLGEITDPGQLMTDSMTRLASTVEMSRLMSQIVELGYRTGDLSIASEGADAHVHTHALGIHGKVTTKKDSQIIQGMSKLRFTLPDGTVQNLIDENGKAIIRGNKDTITAIHELLNSHASTANSKVLNASYALAAMAKYDKVILNPAAHPRNAMGSAQIALARGVFGTTFNPFTWETTSKGAMKQGTMLSLSEMQGSFGRRGAIKHQRRMMSRPELEHLAQILTERGVAHDSIHTGALIDVFAHLQTLDPSQWQSTLASSMSMLKMETKNKTTGLTNKASSALMKTAGVAGEAFRLEDEAVKAVGFLQRTKQFMAILEDFSEEGLGGQRWRNQAKSADELLQKYLSKGELLADEKSLVERAMDMAEENIVATFPTFSQAPEMIKRLSRHPILGAFPTFQAEMLRNTVNHVIFASNLVGGILPGGVKLTGEAANRAMRLGIGLLAQQSVVGAGQIGALAVLNVASMSRKVAGKSDDDPRSFKDEASHALFEAVANNLDNYNIYPVKNVMPSYFSDAALAVLPGGFNAEKGTISVINLGWTVPEGAWIEAGYSFINDIVDVWSNDEFSDHHKIRMVGEIIASGAEQLVKIFGNEEVLFRAVMANLMEKDDANPEALSSYKSQKARQLNQALRFNDSRKYVDDDGERSGNVVKLAAATLTALASQLPPTTALTQAGKGVMSVVESYNTAETAADMAWDIGNDVAAITTGLRVEEFDFREDYPKTLKYTKVPQLRAKGERLRNELFDPTEEYTYAEFESLYKLYDKYRSVAFDSIANGLELGMTRLNIDPDEGGELQQVFLNGTRGQNTVDGFTYENFINHEYSSIVTLNDRQRERALANFQKEFGEGDEAERRFEERLMFLEQAANWGTQ